MFTMGRGYCCSNGMTPPDIAEDIAPKEALFLTTKDQILLDN